MKKTIPFIIILLYFVSCSNSSTETSNQTAVIVDSSNTLNDNHPIESEYELNYVISVASGYNYDSLREIAIEVSHFLKLKFDTLNRYYNTENKKIILHEDDPDDIWAGDYYLRRGGDDFVSIEMQTAYIDTALVKDQKATELFYADTLKMFVFANIYKDKKTADSLLKILKPKYKQSIIIPTEMYMGCMH